MTKLELVARIAGQAGMDQQKFKAIVQHALDQIVDAILTDGRIELREFGMFKIRGTARRAGRNPRIGAAVMESG
jgi:integration host factor subunit beta